MNVTIEKLLKELQSSLQDMYGDRLDQVVLFGSQARGDAETGSDVDVMVVLRGAVDPATEIRRTGRITAALSLNYNKVVSSNFVSADRYLIEQSPLLINVRGEGVLVK